MKSNLIIDQDIGYVGNCDAKSRRDAAVGNMTMVAASILVRATLKTDSWMTSEKILSDARIYKFLQDDVPLFSALYDADTVNFHITEEGDDFVLRICVFKNEKPTYESKLLFGLKNAMWDRFCTGYVIKPLILT